MSAVWTKPRGPECGDGSPESTLCRGGVFEPHGISTGTPPPSPEAIPGIRERSPPPPAAPRLFRTPPRDDDNPRRLAPAERRALSLARLLLLAADRPITLASPAAAAETAPSVLTQRGLLQAGDGRRGLDTAESSAGDGADRRGYGDGGASQDAAGVVRPGEGGSASGRGYVAWVGGREPLDEAGLDPYQEAKRASKLAARKEFSTERSEAGTRRGASRVATERGFWSRARAGRPRGPRGTIPASTRALSDAARGISGASEYRPVAMDSDGAGSGFGLSLAVPTGKGRVSSGGRS